MSTLNEHETIVFCKYIAREVENLTKKTFLGCALITEIAFNSKARNIDLLSHIDHESEWMSQIEVTHHDAHSPIHPLEPIGSHHQLSFSVYSEILSSDGQIIPLIIPSLHSIYLLAIFVI
jgi:hypothetical protein